MGKRTLRTIHYDLVASVLKQHFEGHCATRDNACLVLTELAHAFADEFEIRAETFDRKKFLISCGVEE